ncbi:MAG: glycosyltransferase family 4 protein [Elusimicrobiaceae bacterium]|nr:glycosyltransferase family 4 protein [Elusimicrobiaceae bacterium]
MKLLFASESHGWSGGANQMLLTAGELAARGHKIIFAVPSDGAVGRRALGAGFEVRDLRIRQDYDVKSALAVKRIARDCHADLVHAHHPRAHAVCLIAKYLGMAQPLIVTRRVIFRIRVNPFSALKYRSSRIDAYLAVCNAAKTELVKGGVEAERVTVIPSAVDFNKYTVARELRAKLEFKPPFRVGMVGHYSWFKGHDCMIAAAPAILKEFPDTVFVFAGRDTNLLADKVRAAGIEKNVEILGERNDVPEILAGLQLFAMPSRQEGIATALIEAHSAGVPAVASNIGGIPDVMLPGETGEMVQVENAPALAAAVIKILGDPAIAGRYADAAFARAREKFALPSVCDRLEAFYRARCAAR